MCICHILWEVGLHSVTITIFHTIFGSGQAPFYTFVRVGHFLPDELPGDHTGHKTTSKHCDIINTCFCHHHHFATFCTVERTIIAGHVPVVCRCSLLCTHHIDVTAHSRMAQNFNCGKTKCSYLVCFGLAPYFHDKLMSNLRQSGVVYAFSFDESVNRVLQSEQMDVIICFWDNQENKVCSRYFDSRFLGHATAQNFLENLKGSLDKLNPAGLIQISMDGPNTNWKLLDELIKEQDNF